MKKITITLFVLIAFSTLNFAQANVEEAVRYRINSDKTPIVKIVTENIVENHYVPSTNTLDNSSSAQLEELGARFAWAK